MCIEISIRLIHRETRVLYVYRGLYQINSQLRESSMCIEICIKVIHRETRVQYVYRDLYQIN